MKDQKIGIVTWFNYANPGTAFQAYALQQYINNIPYCKAEVINLSNRLISLLTAPILKIYAKGSIIGYNRLGRLGRFGKIVRLTLSFPILICLGIKAYRFCSFQRKNIIKYPPKLLLIRDLQYKDYCLINDRYDWVILGSDQLWNFGMAPSNNLFEKMFLGFVSGPRKGAYAPSIGKDEWPEKYADKIKESLSDFSFIGVREKQAVGVVQPFANVPVHWSLDPIFLLNRNEWAKIARKPEQIGEYIFEYCIIKSSELRAATEKLAAITGLPIIEHHGDLHKHVPSAIRMSHPSADTWLGYLMSARYVVTDSFHGCAFSVNMNKDFYAIVTSNGARITSMLELFGLQNRVLSEPNEIDLLESIDWVSVNRKLDDRRKESKDWLKSSLLG